MYEFASYGILWGHSVLNLWPLSSNQVFLYVSIMCNELSPRHSRYITFRRMLSHSLASSIDLFTPKSDWRFQVCIKYRETPSRRSGNSHSKGKNAFCKLTVTFNSNHQNLIRLFLSPNWHLCKHKISFEQFVQVGDRWMDRWPENMMLLALTVAGVDPKTFPNCPWLRCCMSLFWGRHRHIATKL